MVFSIGLSIVALGMLCILLYNLAVYALPVLVGIATGILADLSPVFPPAMDRVPSALVARFAR